MGTKKRRRRKFTAEFKAETVRLVRSSDKNVNTIARELDLTETALRRWVQQAEIDAGRGPTGALTTSEREELMQLRRETKRLRMERDILKKATVHSTGRCNTMPDLWRKGVVKYAGTETRRDGQ